MAEISETGSRSGHGKVRMAKKSTKIDMTPMVDLAFLLLTFFILTSTFNDSTILELPMPDKNDTQSELNEKNVLNLAVAEDGRLYWWRGLDGEVQRTDYSRKGLRQLLLGQGRANEKLMVLIKPADNSKYENIINVLDEITITNTQRYAIVDFTDDDKNKIAGID